jgi:hypothetical protein
MGFLLAGYYLSGVLYSILCVIADVILDDVMLYLKHYPLFLVYLFATIIQRLRLRDDRLQVHITVGLLIQNAVLITRPLLTYHYLKT